MAAGRSASLIAALACVLGLVLTGCGSSSNSSSTASTPAASTAATSTPSSSTATSAPTSSATLAQAVERCRSEIASRSELAASTKAKLESLCEKAAKGDRSTVKQVAREVCEEVIKRSPLPAGPAQEHALAACKRG